METPQAGNLYSCVNVRKPAKSKMLTADHDGSHARRRVKGNVGA